MPVIFIIGVQDDLESINTDTESAFDNIGDDILNRLFKEALDVGSDSFEAHDVFGHLEEDKAEGLWVSDLGVESTSCL